MRADNPDHGNPKTNSRLREGLIEGGVIAAVVLILLALPALRSLETLPRLGLAPGFVLADQNDNLITSEDLRGKIVLYTFAHASCRPPCQETVTVMRGVQNRLPELDAGEIPIQLLTISFDPKRDTSEVLRATAEAVGANPSHWRFATTAPSRLGDIVSRGFRVDFVERPDGSFVFEPTFVLVDGWGVIRAEYRRGAPGVDYLLRDIRLVVDEAVGGTGLGRYAYEAGHLFACSTGGLR